MAANELSQEVGIQPACTALEVSRATFYRRRVPSSGQQQPRPTPARALKPKERQDVLDLLSEERFVDRSPGEVVATLLDKNQYLCSERTMYRILAAEKSTRERRNQRRHPVYEKPELVATAPNQVWSWDITKLKGPRTWSWYYLYVILDIFSRYAVGWMVAERESTTLAKRFIDESCDKQDIKPETLVLHSDRGSSMTSLGTAQLLAKLGVTRSLNRPHVSNDNPFSEAHFKTLKYSPGFPKRFGSLEEAQTFVRTFFDWYHCQHKHTGLSRLTPEDVHYKRDRKVLAARDNVLARAHRLHPERFVNGIPKTKPLDQAVWINKPETPEDHCGILTN
jgi:putative transposase